MVSSSDDSIRFMAISSTSTATMPVLLLSLMVEDITTKSNIGMMKSELKYLRLQKFV